MSHLTGLFVAGSAALVPFVTTTGLFYGSVNAKYFFILFATLSVLGVGAYVLWRKKTEQFTLGPLFLAVCGLSLVWLTASGLGVFPEHSFFSEVLRSTGVLFLLLLVLLSVALSRLFTGNDWHLLWRVTAFSGALFSLLSIIGVSGLGATGQVLWIDLAHPGLSFGNTTFAGAYLVLAFLITLVALLQSESGSRLRYALGAAAVLQFFSPLLFAKALWETPALFLGSVWTQPALLLGEARASSAALMLALMFLAGIFLLRRFLSGRAERLGIFSWSALVLCFVAAVLGLLFTPGSSVEERYIEESTAARILVWHSGLAAFKERPLFGWGPENFGIAHTQYLDNRLYLKENLAEVWFDKAHNVFVETLVTTGLLGVAALLAVILLCYRTLRHARERDMLSGRAVWVWAALPVAHLLQMQTSFDTPGTYLFLALILGFFLFLERGYLEETGKTGLQVSVPSYFGRSLAALLFLVAFAGAWVLGAGEYKRQAALHDVFSATGEVQVARAEQATAQRSDFESLRLLSSSFLKGLLATPGVSLEGASVRVQFDLYEARLRAYLESAPEDYRARMNFAYLLLLRSVYGDSRLEEARTLIKDSYRLSPENPLTHVLHALALLYAGDLDGAEERIGEARALNPDIEFTAQVEAHIEKQIAAFPNITVLPLENL